MKRLGLALLMLLCVAGCPGLPQLPGREYRLERPERPKFRSFFHCPFVVRLTASGDVFTGDCRSQRRQSFSTLADGVHEIMGEWEKAPAPVVVDIDDAAPLRLAHQVFTRLQDAGFYTVGVADAPSRQPIMLALPPPVASLRPFEPGSPNPQSILIDPATASRIVVVRIRPDHLLDVTESPVRTTKDGLQRTSRERIKTVTTSAEALPALLASYPEGRYAIYRGQTDTPWSEIKGVLRTLKQARRDQIVLEENSVLINRSLHKSRSTAPGIAAGDSAAE